MSDTRCPTCGKALACVAFIESDRAVEIPCNCTAKPEPTMAELLAELKAIRSEVAAIRAETFNLVASAPSFALLKLCEAVMSGGHPFAPK